LRRGDHSQQATRVAIVSALSLAFASLAACAVAGPYNPQNLPEGQVAGIEASCRSTMGLSPNTEQYQSCVDSLMDSAHGLDRGRALIDARGDCLRRGARPGPDLNVCELQSAAAGPTPTPVSEARETRAATSYAYASPGEVIHREQLACARLGYDPTDDGFAGCVAGLRAAMFDADHPAQ